MKSHIVINGNAFYEVDEECLKRLEQEKERRRAKEQQKKEGAQKKKGAG